jgi:hypothetical protein
MLLWLPQIHIPIPIVNEENKDYAAVENETVLMETNNKGLMSPATNFVLFTNGASLSTSQPLSHDIRIGHLPDTTQQNCMTPWNATNKTEFLPHSVQGFPVFNDTVWLATIDGSTPKRPQYRR